MAAYAESSVLSSSPTAEQYEKVVEVIRTPPDPAIAPVRAIDNCDRNSILRRRHGVAKLARKQSSIWTTLVAAPTNEGGRYRGRLCFSKISLSLSPSSNVVSHYCMRHKQLAAEVIYAESITAKKAAMERAIARARRNQPTLGAFAGHKVAHWASRHLLLKTLLDAPLAYHWLHLATAARSAQCPGF